jgi:hypothetical protein
MSKFEQVISLFEDQRYTFSTLTLKSTGKYHPFDAEWNYKDVPHLHEIHRLVEGVPYRIERDSWVGFFLQRIGPLTIPCSVFNTSPNRRENHYFTAIGPFVLLIKSEWSEVAAQTTEVKTTYSLGSRRFWKPLHWIVLSRLKSNYRELMRGDIPMRERRGELRAAGLEFRTDTEGIGFDSSRELYRLNLKRGPQFEDRSFLAHIDLGNHLPNRELLGDSISGVVVEQDASSTKLFPRTCVHDGANLDTAILEKGCLKCPWHGKLVKPVLDLDHEDRRETWEAGGVRVQRQYNKAEVSGAIQLFGQ